MAEIEKPTREERKRDRQIARGERKKFRELPKDVKQDIRSSERNDNKRERRGQRLAKQLAKSDVELNKKAASNFMEENPAVGQTLSKFAQGRGFGQSNIPKTTSTDLNNATIQTQANTVPTAGMQLASAVAKNPDATLTDLNKLPEATKAVNDAQAQQDASIANDAISTNNVVAYTPKAEVPAVASELATDVFSDTKQGGIPSMQIKPAQTIENAGTQQGERISGDGSTMVEQMQGGAATFDQGLTKDKVKDEVTKGALQGLSSSPVVAIEKLGIQDYFPNAGESINVGSYSGKYIGNTTIFAAPGARVPFGLYDARMRALKEAAAEKQKAIDKIITSPQTEAQYQQQFNESFFGEEGVKKFIAKHGNNPNAILNDPEFQEWIANKQAKARDITQAVSVAKATLDQYNKSDAYIPDAIRDVSMKLLYGQAPDFKEYLEGKGTLSKLVQDNIVYQNVMPQVEELMKQVTDPDRLTERPFNFKTGGKYDDPEFVAGRNKFMERVMNGDPSLGADVYASGIIKYFDVEDIDQSIRALVDGQNGSDEQTPQLMLYAAGMIPKESIKFSYETIRTDELEYARLAEARRQYNKTIEDRNKSYWNTLNEMQTNLVNEKTGMSADQSLAKIAKDYPNPGPERDKAMENHYRTYGIGSVTPNATVVKDKNGTYVTVVPASKESQQGKLSVVADPKSKTFAVRVAQKDEFGKITGWVDKNLTAAQIGNSDKTMKIAGNNISETQKKQFRDANVSMYSRVVSYEVKQAFVGKDNKQYYLTADNVEEYNASQQRYTYAIPVERQFTRTSVPNRITGKSEYVDVALPGQTYGTVHNINNRAGAMVLDEQSGYQIEKAPGTLGPESTVNINSSYETSSQ